MEIVGQKAKVEKIIENGYKFHFEQYLSEGWDTFRKSPVQFILYTLIIAVVSGILSRIPGLGEVASMFISPILSAGFFMGIHQLDQTGNLEIRDFFTAFDDWLQLFLFSLVATLLLALGFILLFFPGLWLAVGLSFGYPLVVFARFEFWDAIKSSVTLITKNWFSFFGLLFVLLLINIVGALVLGVGLLVTIPFSFAVIYAAYKDIVGFEGAGERDVTDHLVGGQF